MPALPPWAVKAILGLAGALVLMAAGAFAWQRTPVIGPAAVQKRLADDRDTWKGHSQHNLAAAQAWEASFHRSEKIRANETTVANIAAGASDRACLARVNEARRSSRIIGEILTREPQRDANNCPIPGLVPADSLRDALQPGSPPTR